MFSRAIEEEPSVLEVCEEDAPEKGEGVRCQPDAASVLADDFFHQHTKQNPGDNVESGDLKNGSYSAAAAAAEPELVAVDATAGMSNDLLLDSHTKAGYLYQLLKSRMYT